MDDFWAPIVKDNASAPLATDVFFNDAVSPEISNHYVYEQTSSPSSNEYFLCLNDDDGYSSNNIYYESSSSTSPPSHFSTNGSLVCLDNEEEYGAFTTEITDYPAVQRGIQFIHDTADGQELLPPCPPSRTRSKMHDLAIKHRLITDQNTRTNGQVVLSAEEKRTLVQEGYELPTSLPLSREQEEALKIVRRKIKNKLSAQESRRKRKEYIDTLEKKVHMYYNEALSLRNRLKQSEADKRELTNQLKRYQAHVDIKDKSMLV